MPPPEQRRNRPVANRVSDLKEAAKAWNSSYWSQLSWSDVAWGVGKRTGSIAFTIGKSIAMDQLQGSLLGALTVDTCAAVGTLGSFVRETIGSFAAYATSDGADSVTKATIDHIWEAATEKFEEQLEGMPNPLASGASKKGTAKYQKATGKWDPVAAMPEIKNLLLDTVITIAELQAITTAAKGNKMPFNYCDDAHAMWARYYRAKKNIGTLNNELARLVSFATKAKAMTQNAVSGLNTLEQKLTSLTQAAVDSGQIPHYQGGGLTAMYSRMSQCSSVKCQGPV